MKQNKDNLEAVDVSISFYEEKEDGTIIRKNPTTKIHLVEGLEEVLESLVKDIEGAGSISTINGISPDKEKNVQLSNTDIIRIEPRTVHERPYSYPVGLSEFYVHPRAIEDHGFPFEYAGVITYRIAVESTIQFCFDYINEGKSKNAMKVRFHNFLEASEWGEWESFATTKDLLAKADKIHSHTTAEITDKNTTETQEKINEQTSNYTKPTLFKGDLNDLIEMGRYYVADTALNRPGQGGWFVDVYVANIQNNGILHKYQLAYKMTGEKSIHARNQFGGKWTDWQKLDGLGSAKEEDITRLEQEMGTLFQSGVESNKNMVDVLNSMNVEASTNNTVLKNSQLLKEVPIKGKWNATVTKDGFGINIPEGYHKDGRVTCRIQGFDTNYFPEGITMGGKEGTMPAFRDQDWAELSTNKDNYVIQEGYHDGSQIVYVDIPGIANYNIAIGKTIDNIKGRAFGMPEMKDVETNWKKMEKDEVYKEYFHQGGLLVAASDINEKYGGMTVVFFDGTRDPKVFNFGMERVIFETLSPFRAYFKNRYSSDYGIYCCFRPE